MYMKKMFQLYNIDIPNVYKKRCFDLIFPKLQSFVFVNEFLTSFWCTATGLQIQGYYWLTLAQTTRKLYSFKIFQNQNFDQNEHNC